MRLLLLLNNLFEDIMTENDFTLQRKEVLQEVVIMNGGEENAECFTCGNWQNLCNSPSEFVCCCHTSVKLH